MKLKPMSQINFIQLITWNLICVIYVLVEGNLEMNRFFCVKIDFGYVKINLQVEFDKKW